MSDQLEQGAPPGVAGQTMAPAPAGGQMVAAKAQAPAARDGEVLAPVGKKRRVVVPLLVLAVLGFGGSRAYDWFTTGRFLVATDDAYVKADMTVIAAKIPGYVAAVAVAENAAVHAGDLLAAIDPGDYQLAVAAAKGKIATQDAAFARLGQQGGALQAAVAQARAQLAATQSRIVAAQADLSRATSEYDRANKLVAIQAGTQQRVDLALADRDRAAAVLAGDRSTAQAAQSAIDAAQANSAVLEAQKAEALSGRAELVITLEKAQRDLDFTQIRAPFDGIVGNRAVQTGQYVQPGTRLLALIPLGSVYVEANFKETQLGTLKAGQKVTLTIDAVSGKTFEGVLESIAPASGSQYALLPPENATGNFTKIVQRVPVRIRVPADLARSGQLRPGISVVADVHTRDESLPAPSLMGALGLTREAKR